MLAVATIGLTGCSKENTEPNPSVLGGKIKIDPVITRATEVNFEDNDQVGLTVIKADESTHAENALMTFSGGIFSGSLNWYAEASDAAHLVAYYPYDASGAPTSFTIISDQNTNNGYGKSDLLAASKPDVLPSVNSVSMTFKHLLSKLVINVDNQTGNDISAVTLQGAIPTADIDLKAMSAEVDGDASAADITAEQVTKNAVYRAIVVPQTVGFTLAVETSDGKTLTQKLASTSLKQSGQYSVDVTVNPDGMKVTFSGEIENWTDEGQIGAEVSFEEFEGYFVYDGETYNTVTLSNGQVWMKEPLRYVPAGYTPSADPTEESHIWYPYHTLNPEGVNAIIASGGTEALTDDAAIEKFGYLYDMYAALGGVEITVDNCYDYEGAQGICPTGWHIPTRADFFALCGLSNKDAFGETGNQVDNTALFHDIGYGGGKMTLYNQGGWNYVMSGARQRNGFAATGSYQNTQLWSGNTTDDALAAVGAQYGDLALTYTTSSTCYKPNYSTTDPELLTNIQFFSQMTTFSKSYLEGRINVAYASYLAGLQLRCIKNE